jgi:peptidylprolyl isomerase
MEMLIMAAIKDSKTVQKGDTVTVGYIGSFDDGNVFDQSPDTDPLQIVAGAGRVIPGFDNALIGMKEGETKKVHIESKDAYGMPDPQLVKDFPRASVPVEGELEEGTILGVTLPNGMQIPARVTKVTAETVTIDINHPLAGKALNFEITVKSISAPTKTEAKA